MTIKKKIIIISFAKILFLNNYKLINTLKSLGAKDNHQVYDLVEEINAMDFHQKEILYVLNNYSGLSGENISNITDFSKTHVSIQKLHANNAKLENDLEDFNGVPLFGDNEYMTLFNAIIIQNDLWMQIHKTLFRKLDLNGNSDKLKIEQQENFLDACREIVSWVLLDSLDRITIFIKGKKIKLGLNRVFHAINDESIGINVKMLSAILEDFKLKPRFKPTWKEALVAFGFMGFKTKTFNHSYYMIANLKGKASSKKMGLKESDEWMTKKFTLTQVFEQPQVIQQLYKFLIAMNRLKTKSNNYARKFGNSINMFKIIMEDE